MSALVHDTQSITAEKSDLTGNFRHGDRASTITPNSDARFRRQRIDQRYEQAIGFRIEVSAGFKQPVDDPMVGMLIRNRLGIEVFGTNTRDRRTDLGSSTAGDSARYSFRLHLFPHPPGIHTYRCDSTLRRLKSGLAR